MKQMVSYMINNLFIQMRVILPADLTFYLFLIAFILSVFTNTLVMVLASTGTGRKLGKFRWIIVTNAVIDLCGTFTRFLLKNVRFAKLDQTKLYYCS